MLKGQIGTINDVSYVQSRGKNMIQIPVEMPKNCHECDSFGINDLYGFICPASERKCGYNFIKRPDGCPIKEEYKPKFKI